MPTLSAGVPKYSLHRASGQAQINLDGREIYLGPHGSAASQFLYDRIVAKLLVVGRKLTSSPHARTVDEALAGFWQYAELHYRKNQVPTRELENIRYAVRPLSALYGDQPAAEFGLLALQRNSINKGLSLGAINQRIGVIKRVFRWAASEVVVPITTYQALAVAYGRKLTVSTVRRWLMSAGLWKARKCGPVHCHRTNAERTGRFANQDTASVRHRTNDGNRGTPRSVNSW
ncbi:MAG: hypothetical protein AB7O62_08515 [Pirellulales bacterium]